MEVSALQHSGAVLNGRSPLLRLQSDEKLIAMIRRGNHHAFEALVSRYQSRLLAFCRHMLGSREDAEDVLQEVFAAAFNAILADERDINVRPWLYRIARNRSLNHLRRVQPVGVDSMDVHLSEGGLTTADKVHRREEFRLLVADVQQLPETQRTALLLREIDALSYEQISEAMETTVPSVKSLLVRARVSLAEAAEARLLSCEEVRHELGEVAEGLKRTSAPVRRHLRGCERCTLFRKQLRSTNRALAALYPIGPLIVLKKIALTHLGTSAAASGGTSAGAMAGAGATASALQAGLGALASKTAAGLAAAAIVTAGAVEVKHVAIDKPREPQVVAVAPVPVAKPELPTKVVPKPVASAPQPKVVAKEPAAPKTHEIEAVAPEQPEATTTAEQQPSPDTPGDDEVAAVILDPGKTQVVTEETVLPNAETATPKTTGGALAPEEPAEEEPAEEPATEEPAPTDPAPSDPAPTAGEPLPTLEPIPTPAPAPEEPVAVEEPPATEAPVLEDTPEALTAPVEPAP